MELLAVLLVGGAAGWLGSMIYKGSGLGLFGNIIVGLLGDGWVIGCLIIWTFRSGMAYWAIFSPALLGPLSFCFWCGRFLESEELDLV